MRVLVTGGSGFLGINLIRRLLDRGIDVTSLDIVPFDYPERDRVDVVVGDIRNDVTVDRVMSMCDYVVHCAAALPLYPERDIVSTDVLGTRKLLQSARDHEINRFVFISSTAVYGNPGRVADEKFALCGIGPYAESKMMAENLCSWYRMWHEMTVPILRPKTFVGPERLGIWSLLFDWACSGKNFPLVGRGKNRYQLLDVDDLCDAILHCLTLPESVVNHTFNVGATEFRTIGEEWQAVLDHAGHGKRLVPFPAGPFKAILKVLEQLHLSPIYNWAYDGMDRDSVVDVSKAREILGFKPKYSNTQALIRNYDWYVQNIDKISKERGVSHKTQWGSKVIDIVKRVF